MGTNNFKTAPFFELPCDNGETVSLKHFPDKRIVLYFYPKDSTSGCTQQALDFTSQQAEFEKRNAVVIGVSKDSLKKHKSFRDKNGLNILLASDENSNACEAYGVWVEKSMYGKKYMGIERSTFVLDVLSDGTDRAVLLEKRQVKVSGHVDEIIKYLDII